MKPSIIMLPSRLSVKETTDRPLKITRKPLSVTSRRQLSGRRRHNAANGCSGCSGSVPSSVTPGLRA
jgi:hypothetical protein